jgi:membrane-associated phospholipid phosphatase
LDKNFGRRKLLAIVGLAVLAMAVSICARLELRFPGDLHLTLLVQSIDSKSLRLLMEWVSYLTSSWRAAVLVIASGIVVWLRIGKLEGCFVLAAGLSSLLDSPIKAVVNRPRPTPDLIKVFVAEHGSGFPSGHALFAVVFLGFLAYLAITHLRRRSLRTLSFVGLLMLILLIGASRVYLGVHWPSDVLGGYLIGAVLLVVLIYLYHTGQFRKDLNKENKGRNKKGVKY